MSVTARNRLAVVVALVALAGALVASPNFRIESGPHAEAFAGDFVHEWTGAWMVRHGDRARFYDPDYARAVEHDPAIMGFEWDAAQWLPVIYPPFYYVLASPLAALPFRVAAGVFVVLMIGCYAAAVRLLLRAEPARRPLLPWLLLVTGCFAPFWGSVLSAQKGTLLLLLFTATWLLFERGRDAAAGATFGLVAFKPQLLPVVVIAMLLRRRWAFLAGTAATGVAALALSLTLGLDVCRQWLAVAGTAGRYVDTPGFPLAQMHCWYGFVRLLLPAAPLALVQAVTWAASLATVAVLVSLVCRGGGRDGEALGFAGLVVTTVLLSFHLLEYDLTILLLPAYLVGTLLADGAQIVARHRLPLLTGLALLMLATGASPAIVAATRVQPTVPVLAALLVTLARARATATVDATPAGGMR